MDVLADEFQIRNQICFIELVFCFRAMLMTIPTIRHIFKTRSEFDLYSFRLQKNDAKVADWKLVPEVYFHTVPNVQERPALPSISKFQEIGIKRILKLYFENA